MTARVAGRVARIIVAAALTGYLLWRSDPAAVVAAARHADGSWILAAILLVLVDRALMAWRWAMLLCIVDESARPPVGRLLEVFFVSSFVGTFLPASIGGDAVRVYSISRAADPHSAGVSGSDAVASVFMDRMLGVASLFVMGIVGLVFARDLATNAAVVAALGVTAAVSMVTMAMIFSEAVGVWAERALAALPISVLQRTGRAIVESVQRYSRFHWQLLNVLAGPMPGSDSVRATRAMAALEQIGGPDAGKILAHLASGPAGARLTEEAKAALMRVKSVER